MKKILTVTLLLCIAAWARADDRRIILTTPTQGNEYGYVVGTDTEVTVEQGLELSSREIATILATKEPFLMREERTFVSWKNILFARYLVTEQTYAVLEANHIRTQTKTIPEEQVRYNPFLMCILIFIAYMLVVYYNKARITMDTCYAAVLYALVVGNVPEHPIAITAMLSATLGVAWITYKSLTQQQVKEIRDPNVLRKVSTFGIGFSIAASIATLYGV
jgi:hypothetical protein